MLNIGPNINNFFVTGCVFVRPKAFVIGTLAGLSKSQKPFL